MSYKLEDSLIGTIISLNDSQVNEEAFGKLESNDFQEEDNQIIFEYLKKQFLKEENVHFSVNLIIEDLKNSVDNDLFKKLGKQIINKEIKSKVPELVKRIKEVSIKKMETLLFNDAANKVARGTTNGQDTLTELNETITRINETSNNDLKEVSLVLDTTIEEIEKRKNGEVPDGVRTGFKTIDKFTGGFQTGSLNIIAARPAMGKTAFAINLATKIAKEKNVVFISLEMTPEQLMARAISTESMVDSYKLKNGELTDVDYKIVKESVKELKTRNLKFNTKYSLPFNDLIVSIKKENRIKKIDMIIIDYLQLIEPPKSSHANRQEEVSKISRGLKNIALDLSIPIIALSQLSRKVEGRENKRPLMSDLRESGAIEQDADQIIFLYRDDYYKPKNEPDAEDISQVEIIISKNRHGSTGKIDLNFDPATGGFTERPEKFKNIEF